MSFVFCSTLAWRSGTSFDIKWDDIISPAAYIYIVRDGHIWEIRENIQAGLGNEALNTWSY
jgi:hypothetical protein